MFKIERTLDVEDKKNPLWIVPIGDIHNGSPNCNFTKVRNLVDWIKDTPNTYVVGMGDYLDSIVLPDKRFDVNQHVGNVTTAKMEIRSLLTPIKDKIICMLTGNHEYTLAQRGYGDPTHWLCQELGVPYAGISCFIRLLVARKHGHKAPLFIYAHHGWSAGRKTGSVINNIENLAQYYDADVYLVGHSHKTLATHQIRLSWTGQKKRVFVNTGTFLETASWGSVGYAERAGFPPQKLGVIKIIWEWSKAPFDIHTRE